MYVNVSRESVSVSSISMAQLAKLIIAPSTISARHLNQQIS